MGKPETYRLLTDPLFFHGCYTLASERAIGAFVVARLFAHGLSTYFVLAGIADTAFQGHGGFGAYHTFFGRFSHMWVPSFVGFSCISQLLLSVWDVQGSLLNRTAGRL